MRHGLLAIAAVAALCGEVRAEPSIITNPDWAKKPTPEQFAGFYPRAAGEAGLGGRAVVYCVVSVEGALTGCGILSEDPVGYGFGDAALKIATLFQMRPMRIDGRPVGGGRIAVPIVFQEVRLVPAIPRD